MEIYELLSGTAVGIRVQDGVVLASERRVAYGFYLLSKSGKKVFRINDNIGVAAAGILADMQTVTRIIKADMNLYFLRTKKTPLVRSVAKLLSILLFERRLMPCICEVVVGGIDEEGPHIYVLDPAGSLIEDDYTALGTGAKIAIGILESEYRKDMNIKEARELAIKAIRQAVSRDPVSGDGCDVLIISKEGSKEETIPL